MEVTGFSRWFERLLAELGFELWIGDSAEVEAMRVKKRKTVREDARLLLRLMREDRFPRVWVPSPENRHIHASVLHDIGVPAKIAQQQLGHPTVETTLKFLHPCDSRYSPACNRESRRNSLSSCSQVGDGAKEAKVVIH